MTFERGSASQGCSFCVCCVHGVADAAQGCSFCVDTPDRTYHLLARSIKEMAVWIEALDKTRAAHLVRKARLAEAVRSDPVAIP